ncbi:MAG TPA: AMP-binding protein [Candidatus Binatia bacterium]|nr:AMP-binding protein [Candidatus Binatia bacterium]
MRATLPLLRNYTPAAVLLRRAPVLPDLSQDALLHAAREAARCLPEGQPVNLCEDRGLFLLGFVAALLRGQTTLLPPGRAPGVVADIVRAHPGSYLLCDGDFPDAGAPRHQIGWPAAGGAAEARAPEIPQDHAAAIVFTSGSTGGPQPHVKSWRSLYLTAGLCAERFLGRLDSGVSIVATVPPQHMYSLETSILLALAGGCSTHASRPLLPEDVRAALAAVPAPRLLVTTPVHLRALAASGVRFSPLQLVISATAPLSAELARAAEDALGAPVHEIYGCTEAGSMCTRRTLDGPRWRPYPELRMAHRDGMTHVAGPHLDAPVATPDVIESHADGTITLLGRTADMVKIAGKRASLTELTGKLLGVPGVQDGVVFLPGEETPRARLAALVVAPGLAEAAILDALARQMDPVFLPRPLKKVDRLPRNALGKLPREQLLALLRA